MQGNAPTEIHQFLYQLQDTLIESLLKHASSDPVPSIAKDMLKLASTAARQSKQLPKEAHADWSVERWTSVANAFETSSKASPALRTLSRQIIAAISKQQAPVDENAEVPKKRKGVISEVDGDVQSRKKSKVVKGEKAKKGAKS